MRIFNEQVARRICRVPRLFLFLDYDGTLTPIAKNPEGARLNAGMRRVLSELAVLPGTKTAVVSGRSVKALREVAGPLAGVICVGNHGMEVRADSFSWDHPSVPKSAWIMARIWDALSRKLVPVKGMLLENKVVGISLHYRLVSIHKVAALYRAFREIVEPWVELGMIDVRDGKKVWEIRSRFGRWNKGHVVQWLLRKYQRGGSWLPVFIGDDQTDEDAFQALRECGVTIKVTDNPRAVSWAQYYIHSPSEVHDLLAAVVRGRRQGVRGRSV